MRLVMKKKLNTPAQEGQIQERRGDLTQSSQGDAEGAEKRTPRVQALRQGSGRAGVPVPRGGGAKRGLVLVVDLGGWA